MTGEPDEAGKPEPENQVFGKQSGYESGYGL
jgi:hypothetical protein